MNIFRGNSEMKHPKGKLVAVGGAINSNEQDEHALSNYEEGILEHIVHLTSKQQNAIIEIITSASLVPDEAAADYITCFRKMGCKKVNHLKITEREQALAKTCVERVGKCDCVIFTGGDQSRLCSLLGETPMLEKIKEKYEREDFVIAGVSAGAAAMSQTMISAGNAGKAYHKGTVKLSVGFGFLQNVIIDTHFDKRGRFGRLVQAVLLQPALIGLGVGENTGVIVQKGFELTAIGSSSVVIVDATHLSFSNIHSIASGQAIAAEDLKVHLICNGDIYNMIDKKFKRAQSS